MLSVVLEDMATKERAWAEEHQQANLD